MQVVPVILAGGIGERFWPMSRSGAPKQLHAIGSDKSMLEETLLRVRGCSSGDIRPMLITGAGIADKVRAVFEECGMRNLFISAQANAEPVYLGASQCGIDGGSVEIIAEPVGKNTAPAIALAAAIINTRYGVDAVMVVVSADHAITPIDEFAKSVKRAVDLASTRDELIVFGIRPSRPETGYGYIELGECIDTSSSATSMPPTPTKNGADNNDAGECAAFKVKRFVEKPNPEKAKEFMESGKFLWNSGMFVWKASTILKEFRQHMPELYEQAVNASKKNFSTDAINEFYSICCKESIDFGIMEKAKQVSAVCGNFFWDDLGSWESLSRLYGSNNSGTTVAGPLTYENGCTDSLVINKSKHTLAAVGLKNVAVISVDDAVLVIDRSRLPDLKKYLFEIKSCGKFPDELF